MAISYLNRLNSLFYVTGNAAITLDMYSWYHALVALFRELSTEMQEDEIKKQEKEILDDIHALLAKHINMMKTKPGQVSPELYKRMHKFEMFLRRVMKESGLQTRMMTDPRLAK